MSCFRNLSIQHKLTLIASIAGLSAMLVCGAFAAYDLATFIETRTRELQMLATVVADNSRGAVVFGDSDDARATLSALGAEGSILGAEIFDGEGASFARFGAGTDQEAPSILTDEASHSISGGRVLVMQPIILEGERVGTVALEADMSERSRRLLRYAAIALGAMLGSIGIASRLQRVISEPILELTEAAVIVARDKNYDVNVEQLGGDEIGSLVAAFNNMLVEIRRRDEEITAAKKLAEQANAAKSDFLATMSHEIRTPMNGVLGMTDLLLHSEMTEKQIDFARTIRRSGEALLDIINDILDFSKIEAGKLVMEEVEFDFWETIEDAVGLFATGAHEKDIELVCHLAEDTPRLAIGDPGRLRQVLANLVSNAIKFTDNGEIVVTVTTCDMTGDRATVLVQVRDTGIGIPADVQEHIFDAFAQADSSTSRRFGGTGLGLAIAQELSRAMGGEIGLDSTEGEGTTFWFTVGVQMTSLSAHPDEGGLNGIHVLLVDDNETNLRILEHQTDAWRMRRESAQDGFKALEKLRNAAGVGDRFDLVLLDMNMPEMDGLELTKYINTDPSIAGATLVMLTSQGAGFDHATATKLGIKRCLAKPIRQSRLFNVLLKTMATEAAPARSNETRQEPTADLSLRVLLVEDNLVNQEICEGMLTNLGCQVEVAGNGEEALTAFGLRDFDVVLMDCQMPLVDGYEATRRIRSLESGNGGHVPIIALTANAMPGDREKSLAAGMDDYLTKPYDQKELRHRLMNATASPLTDVQSADHYGRDGDATAAVQPPEADGTACLDESVLAEIRALQRDGQPSLLQRVSDAYLSTSVTTMAAIQAATTSRNAAGLAEAAHSLKSSSANIGATHVAAICAALESMALANDLNAADAKLALLVAEIDTVRARLVSLDERAA